MKFIYTVILLTIVISSCSLPNQKNTKKSIHETLNETKGIVFEGLTEYSSSRDDSLEEYEPNLDSLKINCKCIESFFSSPGEPIIEVHKQNFRFIVCGYSANEIIDTIVSGYKYPDSSVYFRGFEIFECNSATRILQSYEYHIDKITHENGQLKISRCLELPIGKKGKYELAPVFTINLLTKDNTINLDTVFSLNLSSISEQRLDSVANNWLKYKYPEDEIYNTMILAISRYPTFNKKFKNLGPFDGYLGPLYNYAKEYFQIFEDEQMKKNKR
ncbi:hypothetical protein [Carboxylicivirga sp. N1Y90]|uniref:hypothetical protein n=1 Tax=Carboxylicivirga fragile TaxID=3417571 RepID=UPI003D32B749|nr:hypothetical protein [Marinilabiliaceae bacterium N1Y90]